MATVNITEVKGSDGISGSRNRVNSNFNILGNWINGYADVFGIDTNNGILDLTETTTGKVSAKSGLFNNLTFPASGTATATINSSGAGAFVALSTQVLTTSGQVNLNGPVSMSNSISFSTGSTTSFGGEAIINGQMTLGPAGSIVNNSLVINSGLTAGSDFPDSDNASFPHGGGYVTTPVTPYEITGQENVIYADCGSTGGFMISVGDGSTVSALPAGFELTLINTNDAGGTIVTGLTGGVYTGFNTNGSQGGWDAAGLTIASGFAYRSSMKLLWEPRIDQASVTQKGSWVILSAYNIV